MEIPLLKDIVIIFGLSIVVLYVCHQIRLPTIVGFLVTGLLVGPHGLGLIKAVHEVEILAEIGVVLLLFTIGIEFSLKNLLKMKKVILVGGSLQVVLSLLVTATMSKLLGYSYGEAIFLGFLVATSSTAIVLKVLQERGELDGPHGRTSLAILIFQDIIVVPMMLLTPLLSGTSANIAVDLAILLGKAFAIVVVVIVTARWIIDRALYEIMKTRSRELFLVTILVICFAVVWLTNSLGLSLALGAFLAGLIVSESEYGHDALANVLPFKTVFTSFFFVSVGMLLDVRFFFENIGPVTLIILTVLLLKILAAGLAAMALGFPLRIAILVGLILSQVGEFSFILSKAGLEFGLLSGDNYQLFLAVSVSSMAAAPFIIANAHAITAFAMRLPIPKRLKHGIEPITEPGQELHRDHIIIIGYGINGRNVARAAKMAGIPYVIVETNPTTVKAERQKGEPIFYGDATHDLILKHAGIEEARVVVIAISDPAATRDICKNVDKLNPKVHLIVRTRFVHEMRALYDLGAEEVIPEEFETSVEIFTRALNKYLIPKEQIEEFVVQIRSDGYQMFRSLASKSPLSHTMQFHLPDIDISTLRIGKKSPVVGKSLAALDLRKNYKVTILAIRRNSEVMTNPHGDTQLCADDELFLLGSPQSIFNLATMIHNHGQDNVQH
ncbi:potassium transporter KefB [candidate division KSB1 bacterium]|nr:potassium transporter KefB [candidate division KSB1 bacterium]NIR72640.1 potassium transporter KefB [candidate division KSB1 bacterium]NIS28190.1 potassium transporter KefB [candidate division KSB1 bacterium]NIT75084.1 potassium transporter KefB [candidate division KSB1 bacterium]NIU28869.1 potassium transporter KefB [candidate division KSB1 bacterium]